MKIEIVESKAEGAFVARLKDGTYVTNIVASAGELEKNAHDPLNVCRLLVSRINNAFRTLENDMREFEE